MPYNPTCLHCPLSLSVLFIHLYISSYNGSKAIHVISRQQLIDREMIKLRSKKLFKKSSKVNGAAAGNSSTGSRNSSEIKWELRPGGMLVQKRDSDKGDGEVITVRVSTGSSWHDMSIGATCTFGDLKVVVSMATGLEPGEQRLLFRGKEREDGDHLHMVGVRDKDKVLLLEDPAIKERKRMRAVAAAGRSQVNPCHTIIEV